MAIFQAARHSVGAAAVTPISGSLIPVADATLKAIETAPSKYPYLPQMISERFNVLRTVPVAKTNWAIREQWRR